MKFAQLLTNSSVFLAVVALAGPAARGTEVLVPPGATWKYLDHGSDQGTAWRQAGFDDSLWAAGAAQLGYGDGDEATVVGYGPDSGNKYVTTYFRHTFDVADPAEFTGLILRVLRDDGVVVYLNGTEIFRDNLPSGDIDYGTWAVTAVGGTSESTFLQTSLATSLLTSGVNLLAVEIHQANATSSDISLDLELLGNTAAGTIVRGPYLQQATPTSIVLRWRTDVISDSRVRYGTDPANLDVLRAAPTATTEHEVQLTGLLSGTRYYYELGNEFGWFTGDADDYFMTPPPAGTVQPTRVWVVGDSGTADANAATVRNAYLNYAATRAADLWLMLGDNAYNSGTDAEYQAAVFNMYPTILENTVLWPTRGNHESDLGGTGSTYYNIFTLPTAGEAGGLASGTEAYYSFDYANIHFICLDSQGSSRSATGPMAIWLENDLAATVQEWIIAFWHHPPYTKGSHNSDTESQLIDMRANFLPILEAGGVDLVLTGHSHSYERSILLDGHYGSSGTLAPEMKVDTGDGRLDGNGAYQKPEGLTAHQGAVYAVAGSSGKISGGSLNHPAMFISLNKLGSMVLDLGGNQLDAIFLEAGGAIGDYFSIQKASANPVPPAAPANLAASAVSEAEIALSWSDQSNNETGFAIERSPDGVSFVQVATTGAGTTLATDTGLAAETTYYYRVRAFNDHGSSDYSNTASASTPAPPAGADVTANSELALAGTVSGSFADTDEDDAIYETLTERESGGKPAARHSYLEHKWLFQLTGGNSATFLLNAHRTPSGDDDAFAFAYATDDANYTPMLVVTKTTDDGLLQSFNLPDGLTGTVYVRVRDTDQTPGNRALDSLFVDHMFIRTENPDPATVPAAPAALSATARSATEVELTWTDNANNEYGFEVERSADGLVWTKIADPSANSTRFVDIGLVPESTQHYRVRAYNGAGPSDYSNTATATTPAGSALALTATGNKVKGVQEAELAWSGAQGTSVDIYRDGVKIATVPTSSTGSYNDPIGNKGAGVYTYVVCEAGTPTCSNEAVIVF